MNQRRRAREDSLTGGQVLGGRGKDGSVHVKVRDRGSAERLAVLRDCDKPGSKRAQM